MLTILMSVASRFASCLAFAPLLVTGRPGRIAGGSAGSFGMGPAGAGLFGTGGDGAGRSGAGGSGAGGIGAGCLGAAGPGDDETGAAGRSGSAASELRAAHVDETLSRGTPAGAGEAGGGASRGPSPDDDAARATGSRRPSISVVVCSHDRLDYVRSCMDSLTRQTVGPEGFEIILVDSGSSPEIAAEMERMAGATPNARLIRLDASGVSLARNEGARAARGQYVAYIDDDAMAAPDWVEQIQTVLAEHDCRPAVLGGRVLPEWERPLPDWWPASLRGVLSIIEYEGAGEYRTEAVPAKLEPYGVNMVLRRDAMLEIGGFLEELGRLGLVLQSDEEVQLAWKLQDAGYSAIYDSRVTVRHLIQAKRFTAEWLLARLYWQGASTVRTRRLLGQDDLIRRDFPRRLLVEALTLPVTWLAPKHSTRFLAARWRHAYASGFTREALQCGSGKRAVLLGGKERGPC